MKDRIDQVGSNINDAICFMEREIKLAQALIDVEKLSYLQKYTPQQINVYAYTPIIAIGVIGFMLAHGGLALFFFILPFFLCMGWSLLSHDFMHQLTLRNQLSDLVSDLKRLQKYDPTLDVGFNLNARGWFDWTIIKAMAKKHEKEIKQRG
jgi:hypothetical protein